MSDSPGLSFRLQLATLLDADWLESISHDTFLLVLICFTAAGAEGPTLACVALLVLGAAIMLAV